MKKKVAIIDYGLGNILSAKNSFLKVSLQENISAEVYITSDPKKVFDSTHIVLPGQGAFKTCIENLFKIDGMVNALTEMTIIKKIPFLGICIGMQLLADVSYENGKHIGLGWIPGEIKKIEGKKLKLPHMGWNEIKITKPNKLVEKSSNNDFYFVHSYYFNCFDPENIIGISNYGSNFPSFIFYLFYKRV